MNTKNRKYYEEISIARGIGIILVVLGHAFPNIKEGSVSEFIFNWIYSFHMPLFIFLAGFVSSKFLYAQTNIIKIKFIKERFKRLLVPYFVLGILYLPLKLLMNDIANSKYNVADLRLILVGNNPNYALWTLYTLFIMSLIAIIFINKENIIISIIFSIPIMIFSYFIQNNAIGLYMVFKNMIFYLAGLYFFINYDNIKNILLSMKVFITSGILLFIINYINFKLKISDIEVNILFNIVTSSIGILFALGLSLKIYYINNMWKKVFLYLGNFSMDIYVLSTFIQPAVRVILYQQLHMNFNTYIFLSVIIVILLSILLSKLLIRKIKIMSKIIIGM